MQEIKTNPELQKYIKELDGDVKIDSYNLYEKSMMCSSLWAKWLSYLYHEKENLQRISDTKQKIMKKKLDSANSKTTDSVLRLKNEDKIANNDENIIKLNVLYKYTQDNIDFIERALNIFQNFSFQIKNCLELYKLNMQH